jgi:hypothetical protein
LTTKFTQHTRDLEIPECQSKSKVIASAVVTSHDARSCASQRGTSRPRHSYSALQIYPMLFSCQTSSHRITPASRFCGPDSNAVQGSASTRHIYDDRSNS